MSNLIRFKIFLVLLCFQSLLVHPALAQNQTDQGILVPDPQVIRSIEEAEEWGRRFMEDVNPESIVKITHIGEELPEPLRFLMIYLQRAREKQLRKGSGFQLEIEWIQPSQFEKTLDRAQTDAVELLSKVAFQANQDMDSLLTPLRIDESKTVVRSLPQKAKIFFKRIFGVAGGVTIWGRYHRDWAKVKAAVRGATTPTLLAAPSIGVSLYMAVDAGAQANITAAVLSLCAWVGANMYFKDEITELMSQGKRITLKEGGKVQVGPSFLFGLLMQNIRSVLSNFVITIPAFGLEAAFAPEALERNLANSMFNAFARHWVDRWISAQFQTGKWNKRMFDIVFYTWNTVYPIAKNFHLFGLEGLGTNIYRTMAVVGVLNVIWLERLTLQRLGTRFWRRTFHGEGDPSISGLGCRGLFF